MTRQPFAYLAAAIATLTCLFSCSKNTENGTVEGSSVTLSFYTGAMQTRATTPGDGTILDGGGIYRDGSGNPDLIILIADGTSGNIVKRYPGQGELLSSTDTEAKVAFSFADNDAGNYIVYAFGNAQGLWPMIKEGDDDTDDANVYTVADLTDPDKVPTRAVLEALRFRKLGTNIAPELINGRMPLSAKGEVVVSSGKNGQVRLELLRCIAKVTAEFINNTGGDLDLSDYTNQIVNICPNTGYIIKHPAVSPASASMGTLIATVAEHNLLHEGSISRSWYVFPSVGPYTCDIAFTANATAYDFPDLPVTDIKRVDIPCLYRNQQLHIVTRISRGFKVSFNFEVVGWEDVTAEVQFD
jgi:hypothetical protein